MPEQSTLTGRTARAVGWSTGAIIAQQALQFGLSVFLMRLLGPHAFGLIGMIVVFTGFAAIFTDMGFGSALVQRQEVTEAHRSSVFWATVLSAAALSVLLIALSPLVARFYHEPSLQPLTACIALSFVAAAPGTIPRSLLQKSMRFDRIALIDVGTLLVSGAVGVGVAIAGGGVWSLAAQSLAGACAGSALSLWLVPWRPKLIWNGRALRDLMRFGAGLTGFSVVNYWARSADNLLVGRFMGPVALGIYSRAYALMLLPLTHVIGVLAPAMFPALSSIQDQKERVRGAYLRAMRLISFIAFPLMLGLLVVARPFVLGLFGTEWAEVAPLIQILCIVGMVQALNNPVGWIYTSQGRTDWMFWWGIGGSSTLILGIVIGVALGSLRSVAWSYLIANLILTGPCIAIPGRLIGMRVTDVLRSVSGNFLCALGMSGAVWALSVTVARGLPALGALALLVPAGVLVYGGLAWAARLSAVQDLLSVIRHVRPALYLRLRWLDRGVVHAPDVV